jgi:hypothetical protein
MPRKHSIPYIKAPTGILLALALSACGDNSTDVVDTAAAQDAVADVQTQTVVLSTEPISMAEATAPLSSLPPPVPVCPWLSDASAAAAVDDVINDKPMARRSVTPDECLWNINIGFALSVRAVPLADAIDPSEIKYNMDIPSVLATQDGPGAGAVALLDPTWDADKPRPFAFVFNVDNRQFRITTTGVKTSIDRLRTAADEIAAKSPNTVEIVAVQDAEPILDPCAYESATIAALFNQPEIDPLTREPSLPDSYCSYKNGKMHLELTFSGDPLKPPNMFDPDYALIDGFGTDVYMKDVSEHAGYNSTARFYQIARPDGHIKIYLKVREEVFPEDKAAMIVNNLIARTN